MQEGKNDGDFAVLVHNAKGCGPSFKSGREGENYLANLLGGQRTGIGRSFRTIFGLRKSDVLANGVLHESKVGYVNYNKFTRKQILKDRKFYLEVLAVYIIVRHQKQ